MAEWKKAINRVANILPPLNFLTVHHAYFIVMGLVWSVIFWASATPFQSVDFTNSLFLCVSAMTGAGLNTINLSTVNTFQQAILFGLIILGHPILISSTVLFIRKRAFETRFHNIVLASSRRSRRRSMRRRSFHSTISNSASALSNNTTVAPDDMTLSPNNTTAVDVNQICSRSGTGASIEPLSVRNESGPETSTVVNNMRPRRNFNETNTIRWTDNNPGTQLPSAPRMSPRMFSMSGVGARPDARIPKDAQPLFIEDNERTSGSKETMGRSLQKYLGFNGFVSRNSQFHGLKLHDREKLGGVEYKAICLLSIVVPVYFLTFNVLGFIGIGAWLSEYKPKVARENGLNPFWAGSFFAISAFGNNGMSLLDMNTVPLQASAYPLLSMGLLILAGNTLYPCSLRFCIWTMRCILPRTKWCDEWKIVLDFILDHPRRVYTYLFPKRHTWYLLATVVLLNGVDWAGFEVLSIGNSVVESLGSYRVLDGLFQAFAVRAGGFYIVNISSLHQGLLVLYVLMMYVSAYPVLVTIRNTNVYEERSLGIYATDNLAEDQRNQVSEGSFFGALRTLISMSHKKQQHDPVRGRAPSILDDNNTSRSYFVRQQLRSQLSHDIWWICLAIFFITIAEGPHYSQDPITYSTFNIIFEVVSGYSCVGISVGLPNENYSFCGAWFKISKLILIAVMLRGRHRGLPVSIDKSVMLPHDSLAWAEEEDAALRLERSQSRSVVRGTNYERKPSLDVV